MNLYNRYIIRLIYYSYIDNLAGSVVDYFHGYDSQFDLIKYWLGFVMNFIIHFNVVQQ